MVKLWIKDGSEANRTIVGAAYAVKTVLCSRMAWSSSSSSNFPTVPSFSQISGLVAGQQRELVSQPPSSGSLSCPAMRPMLAGLSVPCPQPLLLLPPLLLPLHKPCAGHVQNSSYTSARQDSRTLFNCHPNSAFSEKEHVRFDVGRCYSLYCVPFLGFPAGGHVAPVSGWDSKGSERVKSWAYR